MLGRYHLVAVTHFICVALVLKTLGVILPCCVTCFYSSTFNFLFYLLVAGYTFRFTKRRHLNEKLQPENRAVLITGCDSGFGFLLAKHLDSQGFHVFASCLNPDGPGAAELTKSCSERLQTLKLDVTSDESTKKAFEFVKENLGTSELWALVNNAGVYKGCSVELTSIDDFRDCMEVNALGPIRVTKAFLPLLRQSRGRVVNLTSILGIVPWAHLSSYVTSKYAAVGFNDCLRQELEPWGIRVISVEPELFETAMTSDENVARNVDATFQSLDEDIKSDYGTKYFKHFKIFAQYHTGLASDKVYHVISALEDAISMEYPDIVYRPCRNSIVEHLEHFYELEPHMKKDFYVRCLMYLTGFPKPKEANTF
ncbi:D-beta-hydroxybutyrate dehydrogenase, mitochondrial isoform X1 [Parasteatoda tepidariorum]|uniref:D-beta-hydroxybutyrate dehydrogenase, mitochondrial isoform X1 n=1 Tax=Parasteatoda tepidariorum TaxID=114398 RepID=UPI0039BC326D